MLPRCSTPCLPLGAAREVGTPPHSARAAIVAPQSASVRFTAVSVGRHHTCGLTPAGSAYCWGDNSRGQLGDETTTARSSPVLVVGRVSYAAVSAGNSHTCGITAAGTAYCWGLNVQGQLGDGTTESRRRPVPVAGGNRYVAGGAGGSGPAPRFPHRGVTPPRAGHCCGAQKRGPA